MMREQLATNASDSGPNTQYRVPSGCRNGGAEDLRPAALSLAVYFSVAVFGALNGVSMARTGRKLAP